MVRFSVDVHTLTGIVAPSWVCTNSTAVELHSHSMATSELLACCLASLNHDHEHEARVEAFSSYLAWIVHAPGYITIQHFSAQPERMAISQGGSQLRCSWLHASVRKLYQKNVVNYDVGQLHVMCLALVNSCCLGSLRL